ncbi:MAG: EAL domain-containing protein, partial [Calditrichaceae bacterium]
MPIVSSAALNQSPKDNNLSMNIPQFMNFDEVRDLFHELPVEIAMYDKDGRYEFVNKLYAGDENVRKNLIGKTDAYYFDMLGIEAEAAEGRRPHFERSINEKKTVGFTEKLFIPSQNRTLYYKRYFRPLYKNNETKEITHVLLIGNNLNAAILGQKELRYLAYHDRLTGLKNRTAFQDQVEQIQNESERYENQRQMAILFCDLDNFQFVNEELGHDTGDLLLKDVAKRLNQCVRKSDFIYRIDGDEFAVIVQNIKDEYDAGKIVEKINEFLSRPYIFNMIKKDTFSDQLSLLYQPLVVKNSNEYKIFGSEALVRWKSPELGDVRPELFIPVAEKTNLISNIGEWIFTQACTDYAQLLKKVKLPLVLSVNFSAKQLRSAGMVNKIEKILSDTNFDPKHLQLELTETSYLDDQPEVLQNIKALEHLGIKLALDDFGVGYASLSYLHKVPADTIKIDRSFIKYIGTSPRHRELVNSIILLGRNLNKEVVAEGVERVEDLYLLNEHKCYKYQCFLFSDAITLLALEKLLKRESLLST